MDDERRFDFKVNIKSGPADASATYCDACSAIAANIEMAEKDSKAVFDEELKSLVQKARNNFEIMRRNRQDERMSLLKTKLNLKDLELEVTQLKQELAEYTFNNRVLGDEISLSLKRNATYRKTIAQLETEREAERRNHNAEMAKLKEELAYTNQLLKNTKAALKQQQESRSNPYLRDLIHKQNDLHAVKLHEMWRKAELKSNSLAELLELKTEEIKKLTDIKNEACYYLDYCLKGFVSK